MSRLDELSKEVRLNNAICTVLHLPLDPCPDEGCSYCIFYVDKTLPSVNELREELLDE